MMYYFNYQSISILTIKLLLLVSGIKCVPNITSTCEEAENVLLQDGNLPEDGLLILADSSWNCSLFVNVADGSGIHINWIDVQVDLSLMVTVEDVFISKFNYTSDEENSTLTIKTQSQIINHLQDGIELLSYESKSSSIKMEFQNTSSVCAQGLIAFITRVDLISPEPVEVQDAFGRSFLCDYTVDNSSFACTETEQSCLLYVECGDIIKLSDNCTSIIYLPISNDGEACSFDVEVPVGNSIEIDHLYFENDVITVTEHVDLDFILSGESNNELIEVITDIDMYDLPYISTWNKITLNHTLDGDCHLNLILKISMSDLKTENSTVTETNPEMTVEDVMIVVFDRIEDGNKTFNISVEEGMFLRTAVTYINGSDICEDSGRTVIAEDREGFVNYTFQNDEGQTISVNKPQKRIFSSLCDFTISKPTVKSVSTKVKFQFININQVFIVKFIAEAHSTMETTQARRLNLGDTFSLIQTETLDLYACSLSAENTSQFICSRSEDQVARYAGNRLSYIISEPIILANSGAFSVHAESKCDSGTDTPGLEIEMISVKNEVTVAVNEVYINQFIDDSFSRNIIDADNPRISRNTTQLSSNNEYITATRAATIQVPNDGSCIDEFVIIVRPIDITLNDTTLRVISQDFDEEIDANVFNYWDCDIISDMNECSRESCSEEDDTEIYSRIPQRSHSCELKFTCGNRECGCSKVLPSQVNSEDERQPRLIGGVDVVEGEFPWQVLLKIMKSDGQVMTCGGALVKEDKVITSAHCVNDFTNIEAYFGITDQSILDDPDIIKTKRSGRAEKHPNYDPFTQENDIAVVLLETRVDETDTISFICTNTPAADSRQFMNSRIQTAVIAGFGSTSLGRQSIISQNLKKGTVNILSDQDCINNFNNLGWYVDVNKFFCTSGSGIETCEGDCGGPVFVERSSDGAWTIHGIISYGVACSNSVHLKTDPLKAWILNFLQ